MKTHRNILKISFFIGFISLLLVIIFKKNSKEFQIALAFMGSSFISFLLELPKYISIKNEYKNRVYYALLDIKINATTLNASVNNMLNSSIVIDNFYTQLIQNISFSVNYLRSFDPDYYFLKKKNILMSKIISSVRSAFDNVNIATLNYSTKYSKKKLEININEKSDRNISPIEISDDLNIILEYSTQLINLINNYAIYIFSKIKYKLWLIDDATIINLNNNFKIIKK